jgi:hypothetical protein
MWITESQRRAPAVCGGGIDLPRIKKISDPTQNLTNNAR